MSPSNTLGHSQQDLQDHSASACLHPLRASRPVSAGQLSKSFPTFPSRPSDSTGVAKSSHGRGRAGRGETAEQSSSHPLSKTSKPGTKMRKGSSFKGNESGGFWCTPLCINYRKTSFTAATTYKIPFRLHGCGRGIPRTWINCQCKFEGQ